MKRASIGDGDVCPVTPSHGQMFVLPGNKRQYCPDQSHDGTPGRDGAPRTRAIWPFQHFAAAVAEYNATTAGEAAKRLPDLGDLMLPDLEGVEL